MAAICKSGRSTVSRAPAIAFVAGLALIANYTLFIAPSMWAAAERLKAEQIEQENKIFCERFHMPHGTAAFAACADFLADVRKRHAERLSAEAAGPL